MKTIKFNANEKILLVLHRHWFVILRETFGILFLLILGVVLRISINAIFIEPNFDSHTVSNIANLMFSIYLLFLLASLFSLWLNYYLDIWIITDKRIIDIEQKGLFNRVSSEFLIGRVQDVTIEVPSFITTLLGFGNMNIHTAGEKNFDVREIPNLEEAKQLILEYSKKARQENT